MTSESCYVYLQLPRSREVVTCGRYQLDHTDDGVALGRFVYGRRYLARADAVPLDPFHLPLAPREYRTVQLGGLFGALRDAGPDFWGRRVIERRKGTAGLSELDYLVDPSPGRIGALELGEEKRPPTRLDADLPGLHELSDLRAAAAKVEANAPIDRELADLLAAGSSVGGARPKTVIRDPGGIWLAKFPERTDRWSNAAVEGGMLRLAKTCGIRTPETRIEPVGDDDVLLVKRFDREPAPDGEGEYRHRMVSAMTVLDLDESLVDRSGWSYLALADELQRWSEKPLEDKRELFRRVVFNALISNLDDHPRNHALIAPGKGWRLSPAYDLTPSRARSLERRDLAMSAGEHGRLASRPNLLSAARRFGYDRETAEEVIDDIVETIEHGWRQSILEQGGTEADCEAVRGAFHYPGFDYPRPT